jgi:DNA-binding response OmpR family regulator
MTYKVLIIEDHREIADLVKMHLNDIDCRAKIAADGAIGLADATANNYDLIILDVMLPGESGLEICRRLRARSDYTPILMLTARTTELDRVLGLELGADDYLTKPFSVLELQARVKAIFRRVKAVANGGMNSNSVVRAGNMMIDADKRSVHLSGRGVDLTAKEFDLLLHLAQNPGRAYTRQQLLDFVWGYNHTGYQHTVNSHINRLRGKIETDPVNPLYIRTVWGVGYKFSESAADAQAARASHEYSA